VREPRILIAGIGNIFLGDDAFGVEVVRRLAARPLSAGVHVVDFGIRGFDLAQALAAGADAAILVDATARGEPPGTLYVLEPQLAATDYEQFPETVLATHGMDPVRVLHLARALGGYPPRVLVVGCEPGTLDPDAEGRLGLSAPVEAAVEEAIALIETWITHLRREWDRTTTANGESGV
jgi:hydrogenase maturation protease